VGLQLRLLERLLDGMFPFIMWIWATFLGGGLFVGIVLALATNGWTALADWKVVSLVLAHPVESGSVGAILLCMLLVLTFASWGAHRQDVARRLRSGLVTSRVRDLQLDDIRFKLGPNPQAFYFERPDPMARACEALRRAAVGGAGGPIGLIIVGMPMVGKTRLAIEALRRTLPMFELLVWPPRDAAPSLDAIEGFRGQRVALLLDDLQESARREEAAFVLAAVARLRQVCKRLVVVATSRAGNDNLLTQREFGALLPRLSRVDLKRMDPASDEAIQFLLEASDKASEPHVESFDGTPGSVLLDLERRTTQLRNLPSDAQCILKALALLRSAEVESFPEVRVRRVARVVFDLPEVSSRWDKALARLLDDEWVVLRPAARGRQRTLRIFTDAYLDKCVAAIYPLQGKSMEDDFPLLQGALGAAPPDSEALFSLGDALRHSEPPATAPALACIQIGLAALNKRHDPDLWARGQTSLGLTYAKHMDGDHVDNLKAALRAFSEALDVNTQKMDPVAWAETTYNRALARSKLAQAFARDNMAACTQEQAAALTELESALAVFRTVALPDNVNGVEEAIRFVQAIECR
jgi:hypothetical protein